MEAGPEEAGGRGEEAEPAQTAPGGLSQYQNYQVRVAMFSRNNTNKDILSLCLGIIQFLKASMYNSTKWTGCHDFNTRCLTKKLIFYIYSFDSTNRDLI